MLDLSVSADEVTLRRRVQEALDQLGDAGLRLQSEAVPAAEACFLIAGPLREQYILNSIERKIAECALAVREEIGRVQVPLFDGSSGDS
jgi:hypothetical protein